MARRLRGLDPHALAAIDIGGVADVERAAGAMQGVIAEALVILRHFEHGQHVAPRPVRAAEPSPAVVVRRQPAYVDHGVKRPRPADHAAARPKNAPAAAAKLRHGVKPPIGRGVEHCHPVGRDVRGLWRGAARLQHQHLAAPIALSRLARTQPAEPAPRTMVSYIQSPANQGWRECGLTPRGSPAPRPARVR